MPSSDLTTLFNKSEGRFNRERALNAGRARHALRIDEKTLVQWAVAESMHFVKDSVNQLWLVAGTPPVDDRVAIFIVEPPDWNFGSQAVGGGPTAAKQFVIRNVGDKAGRTASIEVYYGTPFFTIVNDLASASTVLPGGTASFEVTFDPAAAIQYTGTIYIPNDSEASNIRVNLSGTGT